MLAANALYLSDIIRGGIDSDDLCIRWLLFRYGQSKLASIFEIAVYEEKMNIDEFGEKFISSLVSKAIKKGNPIYLVGKSANELLGLVIHKQMEQTD